MDLIQLLIQQARQKLKPNGLIALEIGIHRDKQVENLLADAGFSAIQTVSDLNGIPRFPMARRYSSYQQHALHIMDKLIVKGGTTRSYQYFRLKNASFNSGGHLVD